MSLRAFHIVFIFLSMLLSFGFATWSYGNYQVQKDTTDLVLAVISGIAGLGLIVYGVYFLRKMRKIIL
jgi:nitrate reductase gamma subunit